MRKYALENMHVRLAVVGYLATVIHRRSMWIIFVALCTCAFAAMPPASISVMVVGNSLTLTGDVPMKLKTLLQHALGDSTTIIVEDYAVPGTNLSISSNAMMDPKSAMYRLIRQPWDFVILQEQSQLPGRWLETTSDPVADLVVGQTEDLYRLANIPLPSKMADSAAPKQDFQWMVLRVEQFCRHVLANCMSTVQPGGCADPGSSSRVAVQGPRGALLHVGILAGGPQQQGPVSRFCNDARAHHTRLPGVCCTGWCDT